MVQLVTFDTQDYILDLARASGAIVSFCILILMGKIFKQRKHVRGTYYNPVVIFTTFWLIILFLVQAIPLILNEGVISSGPIFTLIAASYVWSIAGTGWILSTFVRQYKEALKIVEDHALNLTSEDKAA